MTTTRDYSTIFFDPESYELCQDVDEAITKCNLWEWFKNYEPEPNQGFMFSRHENLEKINKEMKFLHGHSGFSYAWTFKQIHFVAKYGFEALKEKAAKKREENSKALENTEG